MILRDLELTHVGPFRGTVRLGPFGPGLNILAAPNESGKSASLQAAARALFDKHTSKAEEIKTLQPAGTELAPRVKVEFEIRGARFKIEKVFLQTPRSLLSRWENLGWKPIADADAADQRLQELLHSTLPGRGATRPEHWGFLGFLWARQGELSDWPNLADDPVGQRIRARLARVQIDPLIEKVSTRLGAFSDALITSTGQAKTGGALRSAEDELVQIESELTKVRLSIAELASAFQRHQQLDAEVNLLTKEHEEREKIARELSEQTAAGERLRHDLEVHNAQLKTAENELNAIVEDERSFQQRERETVETQASVLAAGTTVARIRAELAALRSQVEEQEKIRPEYEAKLVRLRAEHGRVQALSKLRQLTAESNALEVQITAAAQTAEDIAQLEKRKMKLPDLTAEKVLQLEQLTDRVRILKVQSEALGLTVDLTPDLAAQIRLDSGQGASEEALAPGTRKRVHSPASLDLDLIGWGRISIRSGAKETTQITRELEIAERNLCQALEDAEVVSLEAAREALAIGRDLEAELRLTAKKLVAQLPGASDLNSVREAAARLVRRIETQIETIKPTPAEHAFSRGDLDTQEARLSEEIPGAEKTLVQIDHTLASLRHKEREIVAELQQEVSAENGHRARLQTLGAQIEDLRRRYPDGIQRAKERAQITFAQTEARVAATRKNLPTDFDKLPERSRRAVVALQSIANDVSLRRTERDQTLGQLGTLGGQGLYSRETELEEKKAEATLRRDDVRSRAWAARLAHDLIEYRKQGATKAALTPLEERLTASFGELTGRTDRKVFLDETLQIAGLGPDRERIHGFKELSQGAKEQLLLCLRIAVAQELSAEEPQTLILDDVLVNTDPVRQLRIMDLLATLSTTLQIVILTCHPERYRGSGEWLNLAESA